MSAFHDSNLARAAGFVRQHYTRVLLTSALVLIPCFWQSHAGFGDFPSHLYNASLYPKVAAGELHGLTVSGQHTNILSDVLLTSLLQHASASVAERVVLASAALLIFWGMFAMVATISARPSWWLSPFFAMLTYGWAFHLGFVNNYIATGLSFLVFALLWPRPTLIDVAAAIPLAVLAALAHPVPLFWAAGTLTFGWIVQRHTPVWRWAWLAAGVVVLVAINRFTVVRLSGEWIPIPLLNVTGADQFYIFRARFYWLAVAVAAFWLVLLLRLMREGGKQIVSSAPMQMYLLTCAAVFLMPIAFIPPGQGLRFGFLADRLSLMAAVLACAVLAPLKAGRWMSLFSGALAILFFAFLYTDQRQLNRMESKVEELVATIPAGQRVAALLYYPRSRYEANPHALDRVCIGRCWSYGNYEPSSGQFRIRATGPNPYVLWKNDDMDDLQHGRYVVKQSDLPLYQIYACGPRPLDLCIRPLHAGERNGSIDLLRHW